MPATIMPTNMAMPTSIDTNDQSNTRCHAIANFANQTELGTR
jgi:hypothetical protein